MAEIKELSDDELASVVGGVGEGNAKYPAGTKFLISSTKFEQTQMVYRIISFEETNGMIMYTVQVDAFKEAKVFVSNIFETPVQMWESSIDDCLADGSFELYNG